MNRTLFLFISLFAAVVFFSCKKSTDIGADVLPPGDSIGGLFSESLELVTKTVREDSLPTSYLTKYILGCMSDDVFGKSTAGIFAQFQPSPARNLSMDTCSIDSIVLCLVYIDKYGASEFSAVNVYQLNEMMNRDSVYYSNRTFLSGALIKSLQVVTSENFKDSVSEFGSKAKMLRIKLDDQQFNDHFKSANGSSFATVSAFQSFFNGFYLSPDMNNPGKGLIYLNLADANTRLTLYYHSNTLLTAQHINFVIGEQCAHTNYYQHDYSGSPAASALTNGNDSVSYVLGMAGLRSKITIPDLKSLGNILVNRAEFEVTQLFDQDANEPPSAMLLLSSDSLGRSILIRDIALTRYGGIKSIIKNSDGNLVAKYTFNISDHIQEVVNSLKNKNADYGLFLVNYPFSVLVDPVFTSTLTASRVVLGGGKRSDTEQMKLKLIYTKLE